jgi:hypothetical protein
MSPNLIHAPLATPLAVAMIILVALAGLLALTVSDGASGSTPAAETGTRFEGYEAGIAAVVRARSATGEDESRVAAAIAGK